MQRITGVITLILYNPFSALSSSSAHGHLVIKLQYILYIAPKPPFNSSGHQTLVAGAASKKYLELQYTIDVVASAVCPQHIDIREARR